MSDERTVEPKSDVSSTVRIESKCCPNHSAATPLKTENVMKPPGLRVIAKTSDADRTISSSSNGLPDKENALKLSHGKPSSVTSSTSSSCSITVAKNSAHELKASSKKFNGVSTNIEFKNATDLSLEANVSIKTAIGSNAHQVANVSSPVNAVKSLENVISIDDVLQLCQSEMDRILSYSANRVMHEQEIFEKLTSLLFEIDSAITVSEIGSVTYGFGGANTNFNILVAAGKIYSIYLITWFIDIWIPFTIHFSSCRQYIGI